MDPHSFFADPDPAVFLNADPVLALKKLLKLLYEKIYLFEEKKQKRLLSSRVSPNFASKRN